MNFSKEFIQQVKDATDLFELVKEYAPDLKKIGDNLAKCRCPNPKHEDNNPSFFIKLKEQTWCCYGCHHEPDENGRYQTDCISFLRWINNNEISFTDCVIELAKRADIPIPNDKYQDSYDYNYNLAKKYMNDLNQESLDYLFYRGLNKNDINNWMIGYKREENRIVFPLFDRNKNIIGFNRRLITKETKGLNRKYLLPNTSELFKKSRYLYGLHNINKKVEYIIITEGVMDVILATKYNIPNVICTLGCDISREQIDIIKNLKLQPIIIFDNDDAGNKYLKYMEAFVKENIYPKVCLLPKNKDLADLCFECKSASRQYIQQNTFTFGYLKIKDIIDNYTKEKYELILKYQPLINKALSSVPSKAEQKVLKSFLIEEIR